MYLFGDIHRGAHGGMNKLSLEKFPEQEFLSKKDFVCFLGDFGFYHAWGDVIKERLKWLKSRNYTTLFIDGNHDAHDFLDSCETTFWNGGRVHNIDGVIHLMRGQVYVINGVKYFTFGGAQSVDRESRLNGYDWFEREMPSDLEMKQGLKNLKNHNYEVDYILTHTGPSMVMESLLKHYFGKNKLETYFDGFLGKVKFKHWYFGHTHMDRNIGSITTVFNKFYKV